MHKSARLTHLKGNFMSNNTTADVTGIFSLDTNRLVGLAAKGSPDVTYLAGQDTPTSGIPLTVTLTSDGGIKVQSGNQRLVSLGLRTSPLRCATFGDSTANIGLGNTDCAVFDAVFPASGPTVLSYELSKWNVYQFYPQAKMVANGGISGETTTQMLARDSAGYTATRKSIGDVLNLAPDVVFLRGGSINNLTPITAGNYDATIATCYAEHVMILNKLISGGVAVIDEGLFGYSGAVATYPDLVRSAIVKLNQMFSDYVASLDKANVVFVQAGLCDSSGYLATAASNDGIHLNMYGARVLGQVEAGVLENLFGVSSGPRFPGSNLISNPLFSSTGAVGYGIAPTGYTATGTNATLANAKLEVIDGKLFWTVEVTPTTTANSVSVNTPFDVTGFGIVANDVFGFEMDTFISGIDGVSAPPAVTGLYVRNDIYKSGAGRLVPSETITAMGGFPSVYKAHVSFSYRCQEPSANLTTSSTAPFYFGTGTLTPYKVGIACPRLVKLGQAALTS